VTAEKTAQTADSVQKIGHLADVSAGSSRQADTDESIDVEEQGRSEDGTEGDCGRDPCWWKTQLSQRRSGVWMT